MKCTWPMPLLRARRYTIFKFRIKVSLNKVSKWINPKPVDFKIDNYIFWSQEIQMNDVTKGHYYAKIHRASDCKVYIRHYQRRWKCKIKFRIPHALSFNRVMVNFGSFGRDSNFTVLNIYLCIISLNIECFDRKNKFDYNIGYVVIVIQCKSDVYSHRL